MCKFKSAIVVKDATRKGGFNLLMSPWTESHSELIEIFKLNDGKMLHFARVEFTPDKIENAWIPQKYTLRIDEGRKPEWFGDEMLEAVSEKMRDYIKSIIVSGDIPMLIGGQFIISPDAKILQAHTMVIAAVCGGVIHDVTGGIIHSVNGGVIHSVAGGTIHNIDGGTIHTVTGGIIHSVNGGVIHRITGGIIHRISGGMINWLHGGIIKNMCGGLIRLITSMFNPIVENISEHAIIEQDNRKQT